MQVNPYLQPTQHKIKYNTTIRAVNGLPVIPEWPWFVCHKNEARAGVFVNSINHWLIQTRYIYGWFFCPCCDSMHQSAASSSKRDICMLMLFHWWRKVFLLITQSVSVEVCHWSGREMSLMDKLCCCYKYYGAKNFEWLPSWTIDRSTPGTLNR